EAGVQVFEALALIRDLLRPGIGARQFLDLQVAEPALGAFRLERQVTLARVALADAGYLLAVDVQLDDAVVGDHAVVVPLVGALGAKLGRDAPLSAGGMRSIRDAGRSVDAKEIAVAGSGHRAGL